VRTPPVPLFIKEGEEAQPKGAFEKRCPSSTGRTGGLGVSHGRMAIRPYINPAVGARLASPLDQQGVWMLFPPFKGDIRGLT